MENIDISVTAKIFKLIYLRMPFFELRLSGCQPSTFSKRNLIRNSKYDEKLKMGSGT